VQFTEDTRIKKGEIILQKLTATICVLSALAVHAGRLQFEGVIGNSGEMGRPVLFGKVHRNARGLGAAYDAGKGVLYDRAGEGTLNAYALDGRMLARYKLPQSGNHQDRITICGNHLVLLLNNRLYTLPTGAPDGTEASPVNNSVKEPVLLSSSSRDGSLAILCKDRRILLFNPDTSAEEEFGKAPEGRFTGMDWDADGNFYLLQGKTAHKMQNGRALENEDWPLVFAGHRESGIDRPIRIGRYWYGSAWHGTIKRFTVEFEPAPGVVLGGASGHFIGHVAGNYDIELAQGISEISPGLFAVSGLYGIIHLAEWNGSSKRLILRRRIGSIFEPSCIELDSQGRILNAKNIWEWNCDALSPASISHVFKVTAPCSHFDGDTIIGIGEIYGRPGIVTGTFSEEELRSQRLENLDIPEDIVGTALYQEQPRKGGWRLLVLGSEGRAVVHEVVRSNRDPWRKCLGESTLLTSSPVKRWTAVAMQDAETLVAAGDGQVISFKRVSGNWKECKRWNDSFGKELYIAVDSGRMAVSDTENNRIAVYTHTDKRKLAETGIHAPQKIAINGDFIAVYESTAQRILKYRLVQ
jgi:hypothetical protein